MELFTIHCWDRFLVNSREWITLDWRYLSKIKESLSHLPPQRKWWCLFLKFVCHKVRVGELPFESQCPFFTLSVPDDAQLWRHRSHVASVSRTLLSVWRSNAVLLDVIVWVNKFWAQVSSELLPLQLFLFLNTYPALTTVGHSFCSCYEKHKNKCMVLRLR